MSVEDIKDLANEFRAAMEMTETGVLEDPTSEAMFYKPLTSNVCMA